MPATSTRRFASSPVTSATEDELYSYAVEATDPDVGDSLSFSLDLASAGTIPDAAKSKLLAGQRAVPENVPVAARPFRPDSAVIAESVPNGADVPLMRHGSVHRKTYLNLGLPARATTVV